ncbi:MAG: membrane protein insertase YidC [Thiohalorhabdus sp.]
MDTKRFLLAIGLTLIILWLYQSWLEYQYPDYYAQMEQEESQDRSEDGAGDEAEEESPSTPQTGDQSEVPSAESAEEGQPTAPQPARNGGPTEGVTVTTDVLRVAFSEQSGDPVAASLLDYREEDNPDSPPVEVLKNQGSWRVIGQTGWLSSGGEAPDHQAAFEGPDEGSLSLEEGEDSLEVTYTRREGDLEFRKTYRFERGSYVVPVEYRVINQGEEPWTGHVYGQLRQQGIKGQGNWLLGDFFYHGPVLFTGNAMQTFPLTELEERAQNTFRDQDPSGWGGIMSRYFMSAWVPEEQEGNTFYARASNDGLFAGYTAPFPQVAEGEESSVRQFLFIGPKDQGILEQVGENRNLRRSVDYGILSFLAVPLFEVLRFFHGLVGNYGLAIILVVLVIKIVFYPLFTMSYRAMAKMRKVQPELQRLREQYGDDRQKLNEEMMRLYREEKVNPLGGCLPILVQIPVFISLYWVLLESVEIRHEPFMLWITDLTSQDPYYVLPILMGASMVVQQLLNPAPLDPIQKKVMLALPVVFTVFFMQFPAGLVLYWLSNNLLSIAQQWWVMRKIT